MRAVRQTRALLIALALVVAADVAVRVGGAGTVAELPRLPAFADDEPIALFLTHGDDVTRLERGDGWHLAAPFEARADDALVADTLAILGRGIRTEARVDDGDHGRYGLDGGDAVRVEVEGPAGPLVALYVGADAGGGATFLRFADDDTVYRARIGGRARYERPAAGWRDHRVVELVPDTVIAIGLDGLRFERALRLDDAGRPAHGPWALAGAPEFPADQALLDALVRTLAELRSTEVLPADHPAGLDRPVARLRLHRDDGTALELVLGRTAAGAYGRVDDGPVHRLPPPLVDLLAAGRDAWRDRTLVHLEDLARIELDDDAGAAVVERDPRTGVWSLVRPANVDADPRRLAGAAAWLAALRVDDFVEVAPAEAGFPSATRLRLLTEGGETVVVEIGRQVPGRPAGGEQLYVRRADEPARIGVIGARAWSAVRSAWAR